LGCLVAANRLQVQSAFAAKKIAAVWLQLKVEIGIAGSLTAHIGPHN